MTLVVVNEILLPDKITSSRLLWHGTYYRRPTKTKAIWLNRIPARAYWDSAVYLKRPDHKLTDTEMVEQYHSRFNDENVFV